MIYSAKCLQFCFKPSHVSDPAFFVMKSFHWLSYSLKLKSSVAETSAPCSYLNCAQGFRLKGMNTFLNIKSESHTHTHSLGGFCFKALFIHN